jgi:hypothetical protein
MIVVRKRMGRPPGARSRTNAQIYAERTSRAARKEYRALLAAATVEQRVELGVPARDRLRRDLQQMFDRWHRFCNSLDP